MAKSVALVLVMILMVSVFTVQANGSDVAGSGRSLLNLQFFTNVGESMVEAADAPTEAPAPSANGEQKGQTWVNWFDQKMDPVTAMFEKPKSTEASEPEN